MSSFGYDMHTQAPVASYAAASLPADPLTEMGLRGFAQRFQSREISSEQVVRAYLERIERLEPSIGAFVVVSAEAALRTAREMDERRNAGVNLGALMGIPVAVKEIFRVEGLPFGAGTKVDLSGITPAEGPFIKRLRAQGAVILGLTRTTEFAAATINVSTSAAWNPSDSDTKRVCGGSSHGSAAALAAGLCAFSLGSDSGGSVRLPAALCGVVGLKPSKHLWSTEGVFPLSPTVDTIGVFARSIDDASFVFSSLSEKEVSSEPLGRPPRLARPVALFDDLDSPVAAAMEKACSRLTAAGTEIVDVDLPELEESLTLLAHLLAGELVLYLGRDRLLANRDEIDPVTWSRVEPELDVTFDAIAEIKARRHQMISRFRARTTEFDAVVTPTTPISPQAVAEVQDTAHAISWNRRSGRNTRPGNFFDQCGISLPVHASGQLPVGLQLLLPSGSDARLLHLARFVENVLGRGPLPVLDAFMQDQKKDSNR
jgi:aspartyl-tRNA(Asn)/glutamyl-tRNA(Gln) amidotransferase subunit A